ncbi:MAG: hypothetical protein JO117_03010 [Verrucomicrobia bacterium]|nr:hypothetical protein [Verrucomicrobiota bacterium]
MDEITPSSASPAPDNNENDAWDEQIARDSEAGKLDALFAQAEAEYDAGLTKPLPVAE